MRRQTIFISLILMVLTGITFGYNHFIHHYNRQVQHKRLQTFIQDTITVTPIPRQTKKREQVVPVYLSIPSLYVAGPIQPVGQDKFGRMATIPNPSVIGWYAYGPSPGHSGNAILAGHRDWNGKLGVFWDIQNIKPNATVSIKYSNGTESLFRVVSSHTYEASKVPAVVMSQSGPTRTTLITCAGDFVPNQGGYQSRAVVILSKVQ